MKNNQLKITVLIFLILAILLALPQMVNAETTSTNIIEVDTYSKFVEALNDIQDGETIKLTANINGDGFKIKDKKVIIDFNNFTYEVDGETVGSAGTETNGCQLLKGSTVTFKNGSLTSKKAKILIQNYCDLTIENMTLDTTGIGSQAQYVMSNNCGKVNIKGNTNIQCNEGVVAVDASWYSAGGYTEGTQIVLNTTGKVIGNISLGDYGTPKAKPTDEIKTTLTILNVNHEGKIILEGWGGETNYTPRLKGILTIKGGQFNSNVEQYLQNGYIQIEKEENKYQVGPKATALDVKENLNIAIGNTMNLEAKVTPTNTIENITYTSSDSNVATIDNTGKIKAIKIGETEITVTVGEIIKKCKVTVTTKDIVSELPEIKEDSKEIELGITENMQEEINQILQNEIKDNAKVQEALNAGKEVKIALEIKNIEKVSDKEAKEIEAIIEDGTIAQYFDINLLIKADDEEIGKIEEPSKKLTFTLLLPENLQKEGRKFFVIRIHDGKAEKIETTIKDNVLQFQTDKFSTYALAYEDATTETQEKDDTPKTGVIDYLNIAILLGTVTLLGVIILDKKQK